MNYCSAFSLCAHACTCAVCCFPSFFTLARPKKASVCFPTHFIAFMEFAKHHISWWLGVVGKSLARHEREKVAIAHPVVLPMCGFRYLKFNREDCWVFHYVWSSFPVINSKCWPSCLWQYRISQSVGASWFMTLARGCMSSGVILVAGDVLRLLDRINLGKHFVTSQGMTSGFGSAALVLICRCE